MKETLNAGYTAIPKDITLGADPHVDNDLVVDGMEYGDMNEADARASGYITDPVPTPSVPTPIFAPIAIGLAAGLTALFLLRRRAE